MRCGPRADVLAGVFADDRRAFCEDPRLILEVAPMTGADNTGETATAWYGDITQSPRRP